MLPILVIPEHWDGRNLEPSPRQGRARRPNPARAVRAREESPQHRCRRLCRLTSLVTIALVSPTSSPASGTTTSFAELEHLMKSIIRWRRRRLGVDIADSAKSTADPHIAAWLLWAMSWRGVSNIAQLAVAQIHPPTLLVRWLNSLPSSLSVADGRHLCRLLAVSLDSTYRFWLRAARAMRRLGDYLWDPHLVRFQFEFAEPDPQKLRAIDTIAPLGVREIKEIARGEAAPRSPLRSD